MKPIIKPLLMLTFSVVILPCYLFAQEKTGFHVISDFAVHSTGGWDYITVDAATNRVFTSHGMQSEIMSANVPILRQSFKELPKVTMQKLCDFLTSKSEVLLTVMECLESTGLGRIV